MRKIKNERYAQNVNRYLLVILSLLWLSSCATPMGRYPANGPDFTTQRRAIDHKNMRLEASSGRNYYLEMETGEDEKKFLFPLYIRGI